MALTVASLSAVAALLLSFYALRWTFIQYLRWRHGAGLVDSFGAEPYATLVAFLFGVVAFTVLRRTLTR